MPPPPENGERGGRRSEDKEEVNLFSLFIQEDFGMSVNCKDFVAFAFSSEMFFGYITTCCFFAHSKDDIVPPSCNNFSRQPKLFDFKFRQGNFYMFDSRYVRVVLSGDYMVDVVTDFDGFLVYSLLEKSRN